MAFNAAPGTVAPAESGSYGAYARALAEMIREGGLSPPEVFDGVRLRVNEATKGAEVPWNTSRISAPFVFFERAADTPPPALAQDGVDAMRSRPLRDLGAGPYAAANKRDTLQGYEEFLAAYPSDPLAKRIRGLVAARREAMTWRRTRVVNTPDAYWSYLDRYPRGPHAADARRRLESLAAPEEPPPSYSPIGYDIPPPPPAEIVYVDRPVLVFDDPESASCRRRQSSSWLLLRLISSFCRRRRRLNFSCFRSRYLFRSRFGSIRLSMWRRPQATLSSVTSTTRPSSTTMAPSLIRVRRTLQRRVCRRRQALELAWRRRRSPRKSPCRHPWPGRQQNWRR